MQYLLLFALLTNPLGSETSEHCGDWGNLRQPIRRRQL